MKNLIITFLLLFAGMQAYAHSVQIGYCVNCDGEFRLWVEHWHGNANPGTTTMTIDVTVNGVTSQTTGSPTGSVINTPIGNLPGCQAPLQVFYSCPQANTYDDWVSYDFPGVPAGSNVDITIISGNTVFTADGCGGFPANSGVFTLPIPSNVVITPDQQICSSETVTLTATPDTPGGTFLWQPGGQTTQSITVSPNATTTYTVDYTVGGGGGVGLGNCAPSAQTVVDVITIQPTLNFEVQGSIGNQDVCPGDIVQFQDQSTIDPPHNIVDWDWDIGANGTVDYTGTSNPTHQFNTPGDIPVQLIVFSDNGCTDTINGIVTVYPFPDADFNFTNACAGDQNTFTDISTVPANPPSTINDWQWDFGDGNNSTIQNPNHTYGTTGTYNVSLTVTTDRGCSDTYTEPVSLFTQPTVAFAPTDVCLNVATEFQDQSTDPSGIVAWDWDFGDGNTANTQNPTHTYAAEGVYTVTLEVTTGNGCVDQLTQDVTVYPLPTADFNFDEVCEDANTTLTNTSVIAPPSVIAGSFWDIENDGSVEYTTTDASHPFGQYGTYTVELLVVSDFGCADSVTQSFDVFPLPNVDFNADPLCFNEVTTFTDQTTVPFGDNVVNWDWDFDDGNTDNVQNTTNLYATPGFYDVELVATTNNGCVDNHIQQVEIFQLPVANFNYTNECFYDALPFNNQSTPDATQFEWSFGDGQTSNMENPSNLYANAGQYNVEFIVTTDNGCKDTIDQDVVAYAQPNADFTVNPYCLNDVSQFGDLSTINPVDGDFIQDWDWEFGDGNTSTVQEPGHTYGAEGIFSTTLTVTSNYGCEDTYNANATVWPLPDVNFTPTDVCFGFNTQFVDLSTISNTYTNNTNVAWDWVFGDGGTANIQNPIYAYTADGVFNATLTVTTNNGCINTNTLPVTVHPKPVASFVGIELEGCSPICPQVTSTSTVNSPSSIVNYEWFFSDGSEITSDSPSFTECFTNSSDSVETYDLELIVTTEMGCKDTISEASYIEVWDLPFADFSADPKKPSLVNPVSTFNNQSMNADSYQWSIIGVATSNEESPTIQFPYEPNTYTAQLTAITEMGCKDTATSQITVEDEIILYVPNTFTPDNDNFNEVFKPIVTEGVDIYDFELIILNRWGEIIFESRNVEVGWDGKFKNELMKDGTYVWQIQFKERMTDKRHTMRGHVNMLK